jgi:hydrogenase maturation protease
MASRNDPPVRILGVGSPHGDDQLGWSVVDELARDPALQEVCFKLSTPWDLVEHFGRAVRCIVVDACQSGAAPGTIRQLSVRELPELAGTATSSHGGSLLSAVRLAETLGYDLSHVSIFVIEAEACDSVTTLSAAARRGVTELVQRLRENLEV